MRTQDQLHSDDHRGWLLLAALGYLAFVVYGSLVPLDFRPRPIADAWAAFADIRYLQLGIASRADWVANVLLFVPLAFLCLGVLWPRANRPLQVAASAFVLACCAALSVAIEFVQIFFPQRTVSLNDIIAEALGAVVGITAWWLAGGKLMAWCSGWFRARAPAGVAERLLYAYLFVLFGYNVLPLDLTVSPVELFHKWREGKVHLIPFTAPFPTVSQRIYDLLTDVAIWIPAAFLWRTAAPRAMAAVMARVVGAATALEVLQLFVYSRVTDSTDVLTAAVGGIIGAALGAMATTQQPSDSVAPTGRSSMWPAVLWLAGLAAIAGILVAVFWYPMNFRSDWGFVQERIATLRRAPLTNYYYGTEFRAVTEVLHKLGFFFPLGAWLALGAHALRKRYGLPGWLLNVASIGLVCAAAAAIEIGQLFLPAKFADPADFVLESIGGIAGYFGFRLLSSIWRHDDASALQDRSMQSRRPRATGTHSRSRSTGATAAPPIDD